MRAARVHATVTWAYAAGFGIPVGPIARYVERTGTLPWFGDLFPMYGGPWWDSVDQRAFLVLLGAFAGTLAAASAAAELVRREHPAGVPVALALMPVEAVFWYGFALPIPWAIGVARVALLVATRRARAARATGRP